MKYKGFEILAEVPNTSGVWTLNEEGNLQELQREIDLSHEIQYWGIESDDNNEWFNTLDELKQFIDERSK